jgi:hypothetical protein
MSRIPPIPLQSGIGVGLFYVGKLGAHWKYEFDFVGKFLIEQ